MICPHLIMPMAGHGSRFQHYGFTCPKPLIMLHGKPFFYWAVQSVRKFIKLSSLIFVILKDHDENYNIRTRILEFFPEAQFCVLPNTTEGAVVTCLCGISGVKDNLPVLFNDCDHLFKSTELNSFFIKDNCDIDGALLTFEATEARHSFVEKDNDGNITRTIEKVAVSNEAICGCYFFGSVDTFRVSSKRYLEECTYSEYFMSGVYNALLEAKKKIITLKTDFILPFGVPEEYEKAKTSDLFEEFL